MTLLHTGAHRGLYTSSCKGQQKHMVVWVNYSPHSLRPRQVAGNLERLFSCPGKPDWGTGDIWIIKVAANENKTASFGWFCARMGSRHSWFCWTVLEKRFLLVSVVEPRLPSSKIHWASLEQLPVGTLHFKKLESCVKWLWHSLSLIGNAERLHLLVWG